MTLTMDDIRAESEEINNGAHPQFVVSSGVVSVPFLTSDSALFWQGYVYAHGIETTIYDLSKYDWEENLANFKLNAIPTNLFGNQQ